MIISLTLEKRIIRGTERLQIWYKSEQKDKTGIGGSWSGGGTYADIYKVDGYVVVLNCNNQKPVMVCKDIADLSNRLLETTNCELILDPSVSQ